MTPHAFRANTIAFLLLAVIISLVVYGCNTGEQTQQVRMDVSWRDYKNIHNPGTRLVKVYTDSTWSISGVVVDSALTPVSIPEEYESISHDSTHPTPLNAWIDSKGVLQTEFQ